MLSPSLLLGQLVESRITPTLGDATHAPYAMYSSRNFPVYDSFAKTLHFQAGDTVNIQARDKECDVYFFYKSSPNVCTKSFRTSTVYLDGVAHIEGNLSVAIPQTGDYIVMANYYGPRGEPFGNLNITVGDSVYTNQSVSNNSYFYVDSMIETIKNTCFFTLNANFDTSIFVIDGCNPGKVVAYNDDVNTSSGMNWGTLSRVVTPWTTNQYGCIIMRSPDADAKLSAPINLDFDKYTDIYWGNVMTHSSIAEFPFLRYDDAFISGLFCSDYNCISWAVGLWNCWSWPLHGLTEEEQSYLVDDETVDPESLYFFDRFFQSFGFTRYLATENNSVIDLWTVVDFDDNNKQKFTHASVKAFSNDYATGYDWEAKLGEEERIYHPRSDLYSTLYGQPTFYYRKMTAAEQQEAGVSLSSGFVLENIGFTDEERNVFCENIQEIPASLQISFEELYNQVDEYLRHSKMSNLYFMRKNEEYKKLLSICQKAPSLLNIILSKLDKGDLLATKLLVDLKGKDNQDVMKMVMDAQKNGQLRKDGTRVIMPSLQAQATLFAKGLLYKAQRGNMLDYPNSGISYSDDPEVLNVSINGQTVTLSYQIVNKSVVSTNIVTTSGVLVAQNKNHVELQPDTYQDSYYIPRKGSYVVTLIVNGKTYNRQINIK